MIRFTWFRTVALWIVAIGVVDVLAQAPSALPLLTKESFTYVGGFRLPRTAVGGDDFSFAGAALAFNPATNTLYYGSRRSNVAEVSIPAPMNTKDINAMNFSAYVQPFADPMEGHLTDIPVAALRGLAVLGGRLCGTAMIYYDASNTQRFSHFCRSLSLSTPSFSGWSAVYQATRTGWVSGWLAPVPAEWQGTLGGTAVTGNCCVPIVSRTSYGPAAFAFNPDAIGDAQVPATPLLYYPGEHPTLGPWSGSNPTYGGTTSINGMAVIAGTRTVLYVGRNGTGPYCYGNGTSDQALDGTKGPDGEVLCYDPTTNAKGQHAYPYNNQAWLYDLNDFAAVKAGTTQPWEVLPYAVYPLELPTPDRRDMGGATYDAARQILYVSQLGADQDGFSSRPLMHAFKVNVAAPPPPPPPPIPPTSTRATSYEVLTVGTTAVPISPAVLAGMASCVVTAETARVRWRQDGVAPTATVGYPLVTGAERTIDNIEDARRILFIRATGTNGKVHVWCRP